MVLLFKTRVKNRALHRALHRALKCVNSLCVIAPMALLLANCSPPGGGGSSKKSNSSNAQLGTAQSNNNADTAPSNDNSSHDSNTNSEYSQFLTTMGDPIPGQEPVPPAPPAEEQPPASGDQQANNPGGLDPSQVPSVPASQIDCYADQQQVSSWESVSTPLCGRNGRPNQMYSFDAVKLADCSVNSGGTVKIYAAVFAPSSGGPSRSSAREISSSRLLAIYQGVLGTGNRFSSNVRQEYFPKNSPDLKASLIQVSGLKEFSNLDNYCSGAGNSDFYISKVGKVLSDNRTGMTFRRPYGYAGESGGGSGGNGQANAYGANWGDSQERVRPTIYPINCTLYKPICPNKKQTAPAPTRSPKAPSGGPSLK